MHACIGTLGCFVVHVEQKDSKPGSVGDAAISNVQTQKIRTYREDVLIISKLLAAHRRFDGTSFIDMNTMFSACLFVPTRSN